MYGQKIYLTNYILLTLQALESGAKSLRQADAIDANTLGKDNSMLLNNNPLIKNVLKWESLYIRKDKRNLESRVLGIMIIRYVR